MRKYKGYEVDIDVNSATIIGEALFVSFGQMADGTMCYHKIVDGEEDEDRWYSCHKVAGKKIFVFEGIG